MTSKAIASTPRSFARSRLSSNDMRTSSGKDGPGHSVPGDWLFALFQASRISPMDMLGVTPSTLNRQRLLIVDDPALLDEYVPALRATFDVATAQTVEAANREIARDVPSFVITELVLADGDGVDVCRRV